MEEGNTLREALAELGLSQSGLARLMIEFGDDRDEKNIVRSIQRMAAGDARVSGEMRALLGFVKRDPKPFVFQLEDAEVNEIRGAAGAGGHQSLQRRLVAELDRPPGNEVTFTDDQMGELIRYMTRYGSGGFQSRLRRAFARCFLDLFTPIFEAERRG